MARHIATRSVALVVALWALHASADVGVRAGEPGLTDEQQAALVLYESGKRLFEQEDYQAARDRFSKAWAVFHHPFIGYYLGRSHAKLGHCAAAVPMLAAVREDIVAASKVRGGRRAKKALKELNRDDSECRLRLAEEAVGRHECEAARALLEPLGTAKKLTSQQRKQIVAVLERCKERVEDPQSPRAFPTTTPARRAAHELYEAALKAEAGHQLNVAGQRLKSALELVDEPVIRRRLAAIHIKQAHCEPAVVQLEGIPTSARTWADRGRLLACGRWRAARPLDAARLSRYADGLAQGLAARGAGRLAQAERAFMAANAVAGHWGPLLAAIDLVYEQGECPRYRHLATRLGDDARGHLTAGSERLAACAKEVGDPTGPGRDPLHGGPQGNPSIGGSTAAGPDLSLPGWVLFGGGVISVGVGAYFLVETLDAQGRANDAAATYDDPKSSPGTAFAALQTQRVAQGEADDAKTLAIAFGAGGAALAIVGVILVALDASEPAPAAGQLTLRPYASPGGGGFVVGF